MKPGFYTVDIVSVRCPYPNIYSDAKINAAVDEIVNYGLLTPLKLVPSGFDGLDETYDVIDPGQAVAYYAAVAAYKIHGLECEMVNAFVFQKRPEKI